VNYGPAHDNLDISPRFVQQRRRLECALPSTHYYNALTRKPAEIAMLGRM
jgi:hypothetical protein